MKARIALSKARRLIATAKINHLKAVINRNKNRFGHVLFNTDWELEAEIDYWKQYIKKLDGMDKD